MRIMHIKHTTRTWSDRFNRFRISNIIIELIPLNNSGWKKGFRKYSCLRLNKGMLLWFVVVHVDNTLGIISKR